MTTGSIRLVTAVTACRLRRAFAVLAVGTALARLRCPLRTVEPARRLAGGAG
ncbi:MAG: hypothetical protein ABR569_13180 [Gaiellaceae bacterium]